jgi:hypothetical protein
VTHVSDFQRSLPQNLASQPYYVSKKPTPDFKNKNENKNKNRE